MQKNQCRHLHLILVFLLLSPILSLTMSSPLQCTVPPIPPNPTFILSNPSGDLDSTISSYSLSSLIPNSVPVLNYRSTDMKLKPDSLKALELHPIDKHPLYVDDFFRYCEVESEFNIILGKRTTTIITLRQHIMYKYSNISLSLQKKQQQQQSIITPFHSLPLILPLYTPKCPPA